MTEEDFVVQLFLAYWRNNKYGVAPKSEDALKRISDNLKNLWTNPDFRKNNHIRMTSNNPMFSDKTIDKMVSTRKSNDSYSNQFNNCGNGNISEAEQIAYDILIPLGFEYNKAIGTKTMRDLYPERRYAKNYKPDFIKGNIAIEIDGSSHSGKNKLVDYKKAEFLNSIGVTVYRFTNDFVKNHKEDFEKEIHKLCD